jgi:hypothetical protein
LRLSEKRVLKKTFGPKRDEIIGGRRKVHNVKLHKAYSLSHIIKTIKSRGIRTTRHAARMVR